MPWPKDITSLLRALKFSLQCFEEDEEAFYLDEASDILGDLTGLVREATQIEAAAVPAEAKAN